MRVRILYHDHCFDGAASAAFFSRFLEAKFHPAAHFEFTGLAHKASQLFEPSLFDGDVNAIVDFKYSTDPRLTWWFDHHQSAFLTPEDAEHFRRDTSGRKLSNQPAHTPSDQQPLRCGLSIFAPSRNRETRLDSQRELMIIRLERKLGFRGVHRFDIHFVRDTIDSFWSVAGI